MASFQLDGSTVNGVRDVVVTIINYNSMRSPGNEIIVRRPTDKPIFEIILCLDGNTTSYKQFIMWAKDGGVSGKMTHKITAVCDSPPNAGNANPSTYDFQNAQITELYDYDSHTGSIFHDRRGRQLPPGRNIVIHMIGYSPDPEYATSNDIVSYS